MNGLRATFVLAARELRRMLRQPTRLVAAIATPMLVWAFLGAGLADSFASPTGEGVGYARYLLPGIAAMVVVFSTVFASISLIQDRQAGFLQSVLVSPVPRWSIVLGKVLPTSLLAALQGMLALAAGLALGVRPSVEGLLLVAAALLLVAVAVTSLGFALAWRIDSVAGFHGVMNLVLLPLWALSGAMFPVEGAAPWLALLVRLDPLTYGVDALRAALNGVARPLPWAVTIAFAAASLALAILAATRVRAAAPQLAEG